jgi:hypothetical protein
LLVGVNLNVVWLRCGCDGDVLLKVLVEFDLDLLGSVDSVNNIVVESSNNLSCVGFWDPLSYLEVEVPLAVVRHD